MTAVHAGTAPPRPRPGLPDGPARPRAVVVLLSVGFFLVGLDALGVATVLPALSQDLSLPPGHLHWAVTAYTLAYAAGIVPAAAAGDRWGRRRMLIAGTGLFTVASALCAAAPDAGTFLAARALQGAGAAAVMPLSLAILATAFPVDRRGRVVGQWSGLGSLAVACGPVVAGALAAGPGWRWLFWLNVPLGLAAVLVARRVLPESRAPRGPVDGAGVALLAGVALCVVAGLSRAGEHGADRVALVWGAGAVTGLVLLLVHERRTPHPLLPVRLVRAPGFAAAVLAASCSAAAVNAATFVLAPWFQQEGDGPLAAGLRLLPWTLPPLLVGPLAGRWSDRVGRRQVLTLGLLAQAVGLAWCAVRTGAGYPETAVALLLTGAGTAAVVPVAASAALDAAPRDTAGTGSGVAGMLQRSGAAAGVALAGALLAGSGRSGPALTSVDGVRAALLAAAGLGLVGALAARRLREGVPDAG